MRRLAAITTIVLLVAALAAAACSGGGGDDDTGGSGESPAADLTQSAEAGGVMVEATWLAEGAEAPDADLSAYPAAAFIAIDIGLDTHSGDLKSIDMAKAAELAGGGATSAPEAWVSVKDDSHHRSGVLMFPRQGISAPVELTLDINGETVVLTWQEAP